MVRFIGGPTYNVHDSQTKRTVTGFGESGFGQVGIGEALDKLCRLLDFVGE